MDERSGSNNDENKLGQRKDMVAVVHVEFGKMGDQRERISILYKKEYM